MEGIIEDGSQGRYSPPPSLGDWRTEGRCCSCLGGCPHLLISDVEEAGSAPDRHHEVQQQVSHAKQVNQKIHGLSI